MEQKNWPESNLSMIFISNPGILNTLLVTSVFVIPSLPLYFVLYF